METEQTMKVILLLDLLFLVHCLADMKTETFVFFSQNQRP